jgi:hypothetical protein
VGATTSGKSSTLALKASTALALGLGLVVVGGAAADASATVLFVSSASGHDTGTCASPTTACATISYALSQASAGATIRVSSGTYAEQLNITKNVSIVGRTAGVIIEPASVSQNDSDPDSATPQFAIVDVHNASASLSDVNLENLTIDGAVAGSSSFNSCANNFPGVYYHNASGSLVDDQVVDVEMPPSLFGCQTGAGNGIVVHSDAGANSTVTVQKTVVKAYQKNGIVCFDEGTNCTILHSTVTGIGPTTYTAQNGVLAWGTGSFTLRRNHVSMNTYSGPSGPAQAVGVLVLNAGTVNVSGNAVSRNDVDIYALEDAAYTPVVPAGTWQFQGNRLSEATDDAPAPWNVEGQGYGDGLDIDSTTNPVIVKGNRTSANFEYGIALLGASGVTVARNNGGHANYDGIYIGGPGSARSASTGNTIQGNRAMFDHNDGILAGPSSTESGNSFLSNNLHLSFPRSGGH